jgi:hypothetical protein
MREGGEGSAGVASQGRLRHGVSRSRCSSCCSKGEGTEGRTEGRTEWLLCVFDFPTRVRTSATCSGKNDDVELFIDELTKHETYTTEGL